MNYKQTLASAFVSFQATLVNYAKSEGFKCHHLASWSSTGAASPDRAGRNAYPPVTSRLGLAGHAATSCRSPTPRCRTMSAAPRARKDIKPHGEKRCFDGTGAPVKRRTAHAHFEPGSRPMSGTVTPPAAAPRAAGSGGLGSYLVRSDTPRQRSHRNFVLRRDRRGIWFVVPFLVVFLLFLVTPLIYAIYQSLYTSKLVGGTSFSGLANYRQTFANGAFWSGFLRVCIFAKPFRYP